MISSTQKNSGIKTVQRRYIVGAIIGAILGFSGQFVFDNLLLHPVYKKTGECNWVMDGNSQFASLHNGYVDRYVVAVIPNYKFQARAHELVYQEMIILWVRDRAEQAGRTAILAAFWGAIMVLAADRLTEFLDKRRAPTK